MTDRVLFDFEGDGVLVVRSGDGSTREVRQIDDMLISSVLPVEDRVVLLLTKASKWGSSQNLVCLDGYAELVWRAPILESSPYPKEYASVAISEEGLLVAHTWGGVRATLDPMTGRVLSEEFVK